MSHFAIRCKPKGLFTVGCTALGFYWAVRAEKAFDERLLQGFSRVYGVQISCTRTAYTFNSYIGS